MSKSSRNSRRKFKTKGAFGIPRHMRIPKPPKKYPQMPIEFWQKIRMFFIVLKFRVHNFIMKLQRRFKNG